APRCARGRRLRARPPQRRDLRRRPHARLPEPRPAPLRLARGARRPRPARLALLLRAAVYAALGPLVRARPAALRGRPGPVPLAAVEWTMPPTPGDQPRKRLWAAALAYAPHVAITIAFTAIGIEVGRREGIVDAAPLDAAIRVRTAFAAIALYAGKIAWPSDL